ncbi:MAG: leucine-rich repeat domain-containing protein [Pseudomonadota bacterium]|nr:leucine-rich repeat domain-containing protein [Pseudomonadota bacterium]
MTTRNSSIIDNEDTITEYKYSESNIASIECPNARTIANYSFHACKELKEIYFPVATRMGNDAFSYCKEIQKARFPEITDTGQSVLSYCSRLKIVEFPKARDIQRDALCQCIDLRVACFPRASTIGGSSFENCISLRTAYFPEAISMDGNVLAGCIELQLANFPKAVDVGAFAFARCSELRMVYLPESETIGWGAFFGCKKLETIVLPDSLIESDEITDEWKEQRGIRNETQCISQSDYLQSTMEEINSLIGSDIQIKDGDKKIAELLLLKNIHDGAFPNNLSDDEKRTLNGSCASDLYKIVSSIKDDDYERKKEWARVLGVKVEITKAKTENSGEAEDTEKATSIRQQLETIALDIELDKMITKCANPLHKYLSLKEMMRLEQISKTDDIGLPFNSERTIRENTLNEYKQQLDDYIQKPDKRECDLDIISKQVQTLFDAVRRSKKSPPTVGH